MHANNPLARLQQTLAHLEEHATFPQREQNQLAITHGPTDSALWELTLGDLLDFQALRYPDSECLVVPWTNTRWTYSQLEIESKSLARGLLALGIQPGDRIGVMAGNCEQYVSLFFAAAYVGAILVVINNTYTKPEIMYALGHTGKSRLIRRLNLQLTLFRMQVIIYNTSDWAIQSRRNGELFGHPRCHQDSAVATRNDHFTRQIWQVPDI